MTNAISILTDEQGIEFLLRIQSSQYCKCFTSFEGFTRGALLDEIIQTCCAFANSDGGTVLIEIMDIISDITYNSLTDTILSKCSLEREFFNVTLKVSKTKRYLRIDIEKSSKKALFDGECYIRQNYYNIRNVFNDDFSNNRVAIDYDRTFVSEAKLEDLDLTLINNLLKNKKEYPTAEYFLQQNHLIIPYDLNSYKISRAALLLFSINPKKWHPNLSVRFIRYRNNELQISDNYRAEFDDTIEANIVNLLSEAWEKLKAFTVETRFISKDKLFNSTILYPEDACFEALLNALAHRDYSMEGSRIEIKIYEDKLEIISPGGLLPSIKIEDIINAKGVHGPHESRNSYLSRALVQLGWMRELGEGIIRIFSLVKKMDLTPPEFSSSNSTFKVTLHHKFIYSEREKKFLDIFTDKFDLSKPEKDIIRLGINNRLLSRDEIMNATNITSFDSFQNIIHELSKKGIINNVFSQKEGRLKAHLENIKIGDLPRYAILPPNSKLNANVSTKFLINPDETRLVVKFIPNNITDSQIIEAIHKIISISAEISDTKDFGLSRNLVLDLFSRNNIDLVLENSHIFGELHTSIRVDIFKLKQQTQREVYEKRSKQKHIDVHKPNNENNTASRSDEKHRNWRPKVDCIELPSNFTQRTLIVKNIPDNSLIKINDLIKFFGQYGDIDDLVFNDKKQIAFVTFSNPKPVYFLFSIKDKIWLNNYKLLLIIKSESHQNSLEANRSFNEKVNELADSIKDYPYDKQIENETLAFIQQYHQQFETNFVIARFLKYSSRRYEIKNQAKQWLIKFQDHPAAAMIYGRWLVYYIIETEISTEDRLGQLAELEPLIRKWFKSNNHLDSSNWLKEEWVKAGGELRF